MAKDINERAAVARRSVTKSYPEQLAQWVSQPARTLRDRHLVTFMAVRKDVQAALDAGFTVKTIWTNMHETGRVDFCYETFLKHAKRCMNTPPVGQGVRANKTKSKAAAGPVIVAPPVIQGFTFNPVPNKEELF